MNKRSKKGTGLLLISILMILFAIPMAWFCFKLTYVSDTFYDPEYGGLQNPDAPLGYVIGVGAYLLSAVAGIIGICFRRRPKKKPCLILSIMLVLLMVIAGIFLKEEVVVLLPLILFTMLYFIFSVR